jgi:hypothetical protein
MKDEADKCAVPHQKILLDSDLRIEQPRSAKSRTQ